MVLGGDAVEVTGLHQGVLNLTTHIAGEIVNRVDELSEALRVADAWDENMTVLN